MYAMALLEYASVRAFHALASELCTFLKHQGALGLELCSWFAHPRTHPFAYLWTLWAMWIFVVAFSQQLSFWPWQMLIACC